jgi:hypothetical protein
MMQMRQHDRTVRGAYRQPRRQATNHQSYRRESCGEQAFAVWLLPRLLAVVLACWPVAW